MGNAEQPVAAIDLGTNTCLLLVARNGAQGLEAIEDRLEVVRLGEGVDDSGSLTESAMDRAVSVILDYHQIIESHNCGAVRCVATSAFREARNGDELRHRILEATGTEVEAIDGEEEARLVLKAVQDSIPGTDGQRWIVDVGGGSTEVIAEERGKIAQTVSMDLGSVRHTERWLHSDPPTPTELVALQADIAAQLTDLEELPAAESLVGVGGTATTFVAMSEKLDAYDHSRVHGSELRVETIQELLDHCLSLPLEERKSLPGLHPGRAEVIIAGGAILMAVMVRAESGTMVVSDRGLRWGVAAELSA